MTLRRRAAVLGILMIPLFTGCAFANPEVASASWSRAGVGVNIEQVGPLEVRNVLVVTTEDGSAGTLIAAVVNNTDTQQVLDLEIGEGSEADVRIEVPAESTVSFGQRPSLDDPPVIEGLGATPGSMVPVTFAAEPTRSRGASLCSTGACPTSMGWNPETRSTSAPSWTTKWADLHLTTDHTARGYIGADPDTPQ